MPTDTITYPSHSNRRAEVFRCKMRDGEQLYSRLARSEEEITVEIFREVESLIKFSVPWASRVTGTFLSVPKVRTATSPLFSHAPHKLSRILFN